MGSPEMKRSVLPARMRLPVGVYARLATCLRIMLSPELYRRAVPPIWSPNLDVSAVAGAGILCAFCCVVET
jgi:hypothetical protein